MSSATKPIVPCEQLLKVKTSYRPQQAWLLLLADWPLLAGAASAALDLKLSSAELSRLARRGSGSACRSIYGGFAEWQKGDSDETSYAVNIPSGGFEDDLGMIFVVVNDAQKMFQVAMACGALWKLLLL